MRRIFVDSSYFIALLRRRDHLHSLAVVVGDDLSSLPNVQFFTTELVFAEVLAFISRGGAELRATAVRDIRTFIARADSRIVQLTSDLFARGLDFYDARLDQRYSLTDCISMLVCQDTKITDVLTSDTDFEHEGLRILLQDPSA